MFNSCSDEWREILLLKWFSLSACPQKWIQRLAAQRCHIRPRGNVWLVMLVRWHGEYLSAEIKFWWIDRGWRVSNPWSDSELTSGRVTQRWLCRRVNKKEMMMYPQSDCESLMGIDAFLSDQWCIDPYWKQLSQSFCYFWILAVISWYISLIL